MSFVITPKIAKKFRKYFKGKKSESWLIKKIRKHPANRSQHRASGTTKRKKRSRRRSKKR